MLFRSGRLGTPGWPLPRLQPTQLASAVNASGDERVSELLCSSGSRAAAASWLGGSAAAGSGQEGPWLEEEADPAGSEAGEGADGVEGRQCLLLVAGEAEDEGGLGATAVSERGLARGGA